VQKPSRIKTQLLVIGGGGAGARAALAANEKGIKVLLVSKGPVSKSGLTPMAYPSLQAPFGYEDPRDNVEVHYDDIVKGGRGLSEENLAYALANDIKDRVNDLIRFGVKFETKDDRLLQVIHPGQSYPRNLVIRSGGYGLISGLRKELQKHPEINILEDCQITKIFANNGVIAGALAFNMRTGEFIVIEANAIILATGGYEAMWFNTDGAPDSTGDGLALAYRAGAQLIDLEMILYYPTVVVSQAGRGILVQYETLLRDEYAGGQLLNSEGTNLIPDGKPPTRDVLMSLMFEEIENGRGGPNGGLFIDLSKSSKTTEELEALMTKLFSIPGKNLRLQGIDFKSGPVEVAPGVHFTLGGIRINELCETNIAGLFAAGEVSSNLHGANRISGNALAETQVFGYRAGVSAANYLNEFTKAPTISEEEVNEEISRIVTFTEKKKDYIRPIELKNQIRKIMDSKVGPRRSAESLEAAINKLETISDLLATVYVNDENKVYNYELCQALELQNMVELGILICHSALFREETRGHHIRVDFPDTDHAWCKHTCVRKDSPITTIEVTQLNKNVFKAQ
jgi:fumarate reductase (CoM/CoB) subunit A